MSDSLLGKLDRGDIVVKPTIDRFDGGCVTFVDGSAEPVDAVIYCTGYKISFPFLEEAVIWAGDNPIPLYRRVVPPWLPGLYFIGLVQPIGALMPIAETQSEWVADLLRGQAKLPAEQQMNREIARYQAATAKRYGRSGRHAIQVDFLAYLREIRRERQMGARRGEPAHGRGGIGAGRLGVAEARARWPGLRPVPGSSPEMPTQGRLVP